MTSINATLSSANLVFAAKHSFLPCFKFYFSSRLTINSCRQTCIQYLQSLPRLTIVKRSQISSSYGETEEDPDDQVEDLIVPHDWLEPSRALKESEWLRVSLHKWLDDEYCPEETNFEISKVASNSFYNSLLEKRRDLGEILLKMARELETISYKDSFHGAFSSANAAVNLIVQRIEHV